MLSSKIELDDIIVMLTAKLHNKNEINEIVMKCMVFDRFNKIFLIEFQTPQNVTLN